MGTLYIVSTPIGNLQDITFRVLNILHKVNFIACEDTRKTGILLKSINPMYIAIVQHTMGEEKSQRPRLISYFEQNELRRIPEIINILKNGEDVALVSDAGTPTISDPGFKLVRECVNQKIKVEAIPGVSAAIVALTVSGLPTDKFLFLGYLPLKEGKRISLLNNLKKSQEFIKSTIIIYEAPHKLLKTLNSLRQVFGDMDIVICRELTKIYEEVRRSKISESLKHFSKTNPKGEFVILFHH
ncbi:MAG: 16S rRNA (cytidine(1402)-2'-O)-methyltransferase [Patescibacteria group bacterium]|nr:16S rRNA (cytidine(1402)-2'-O)-methyltransferase [Patescibacteria group bacterium]